MDISIYARGKSNHTSIALNIFKTKNKNIPWFDKNSWFAWIKGNQLEIEAVDFKKIKKR
jgi:hypothetical protein